MSSRRWILHGDYSASTGQYPVVRTIDSPHSSRASESRLGRWEVTSESGPPSAPSTDTVLSELLEVIRSSALGWKGTATQSTVLTLRFEDPDLYRWSRHASDVLYQYPKTESNYWLRSEIELLDRISAEEPGIAPVATSNARRILLEAFFEDLEPAATAPSPEGGITISFLCENRTGVIEAYNTGEIVALVSDRRSMPRAWELQEGQIANAVKRIAEFLSAEPAIELPNRHTAG